MATEYLDPNGDVTTEWEESVAGTHYTCVDGGVRSPDAPTTDNIAAFDGLENAIDQFNVTNMVNTATEITNITVWVYGRATAGEQARADVYINGGYLGLTVCMGTAYAWNSAATYAGSWTQAQVDAMQVKFLADSAYGAVDYSRIRAFYVEITYTPAVTNWAHEFNGVAGANIASISGVDIVNIASVKGVDI